MKASPYHDITDQQLLDRYYATHENEWLGVLLQRYTLLLLGVCMKYLKQEEEAKDAVQQVFLKVMQELPKYRVEYFKSWLYMVAKNHCLMKLRDRNGRPVSELPEKLSDTPVEESDAEALWNNDRTMVLLEQSLGELNPEQRQCVTLFYLQKKSYQQVSEETGYSLLQVKSHIQNGKRNLRILISKKMKANQ